MGKAGQQRPATASRRPSFSKNTMTKPHDIYLDLAINLAVLLVLYGLASCCSTICQTRIPVAPCFAEFPTCAPARACESLHP